MNFVKFQFLNAEIDQNTNINFDKLPSAKLLFYIYITYIDNFGGIYKLPNFD